MCGVMTVAVYLPGDPTHTAAATVCPEQHSSNWPTACLMEGDAARRCWQLVQSVDVSRAEAIPLNQSCLRARQQRPSCII